MSELREGLKRIRQELGEHFADINEGDRYGKQMWAFVNKANVQVEDLIHDVNNADSTFTDAISYYGEEDKNMSSSEFFGIFKTFVISYKVRSLFFLLLPRYLIVAQKCQMDNQTAAEDKLAVEKRRQALEENKVNRQKAIEAAGANEDQDVLDAVLAKLRNGDPVRKARRTRPNADPQPLVPLSLTLEGSSITGDAGDIARDMLARLQSDGFPLPVSSTVPAPTSQRRRRLRIESASTGELPGSPLASEIQDIQEEISPGEEY